MDNTNTTIVETHRLTKRYGSGVLAVNSVDMSVRRGEVYEQEAHEVADGSRTASAPVAAREVLGPRKAKAQVRVRLPLVGRENDLAQLQLVARRAIAGRLHVSETTVKTHVAHVLDKLGPEPSAG